MIESTSAHREPRLMPMSAFKRRHDEIVTDEANGGTSTRLSSLSPSLTQDLLRFEQAGCAVDLIDVLAASLRHGRSVTAHLQRGEKVLPLTIFPFQHLAYYPLELLALLNSKTGLLSVLQVEPAVLRPPEDPMEDMVGNQHLYRPLSPLLWAVALHGTRNELLPELTGAAVYRVSPVFDLAMLSVEGSMQATLVKLRRQVASLREIASWPGMERESAQRLLNALYLQSGLMISRSHPAALSDSWFSVLSS